MKIAATLMVVALLACSMAAAAGEYVIVRSSTPALFRPGDLLDGARVLVLPADARITLIDEAGTAVEVVGPQDGILAKRLEAAAHAPTGKAGRGRDARLGVGLKLNVVQSLARLMKQDTGARSFGRYRSLTAASKPTDPWMIDGTKFGDFCYATGRPLTIWRPSGRRPVRLRLASSDAREAADATWNAGEMDAPWPPALAVNDGKMFAASLSPGAETFRLTLHELPRDLPTRAHQAAWMAQHKCDSQAVLLIAATEADMKLDGMAASP